MKIPSNADEAREVIIALVAGELATDDGYEKLLRGQRVQAAVDFLAKEAGVTGPMDYASFRHLNDELEKKARGKEIVILNDEWFPCRPQGKWHSNSAGVTKDGQLAWVGMSSY